jgi:hypothetical protein
VCHQTVCLIARHLEAEGIPTIVLGSALDIIKAGRPPRGLFIDYPLGHTVGPPFDLDTQYQIVRAGVECLTSIQTAEEIRHMDLVWPKSENWKLDERTGDGGDFRAPRDMTPRYQTDEDRLLAEGAAGR